MMSRYTIIYRNYDDKFGSSYKSMFLLPAIFKFLSLRRKYELVEFTYRKLGV